MGSKVNPHHRDEQRWTGCGAGPGQAGTGDRAVAPGSVRERSGPGRSGGEIAAGQGPAGRPKLAAFLGACAGRPAVGDTVLWYQVSAGGAISAWITSARWRPFTFPAASLWFVATARTPPPARATPSG